MTNLAGEGACRQSDEQLLATAEQFFLDWGILEMPVRHTEGKTYYFDRDKCYCVDEDSHLFPEYFNNQGAFMRGRLWQSYDHAINIRTWRKAMKDFTVGSTLHDCLNVLLNTELYQNNSKDDSPSDRLITKIHQPQFERCPENTNSKTFDRIRVTVGLPRYLFKTWDELKQAVIENKMEISRKVFAAIESDIHFLRYEIPINCVGISEIALCRDYSMEYIFELKQSILNSKPKLPLNKKINQA